MVSKVVFIHPFRKEVGSCKVRVLASCMSRHASQEEVAQVMPSRKLTSNPNRAPTRTKLSLEEA